MAILNHRVESVEAYINSFSSPDTSKYNSLVEIRQGMDEAVEAEQIQPLW